MLRFSVRDWLWLTLVVALALGWLARESQIGDRVDRANNFQMQWRMAAGALKYTLEKEAGCRVKLDLESNELSLTRAGSFEPSTMHIGNSEPCELDE